MENQRKVAVVTGTRADYGLLRHSIRKIHSNPSLQLQLIVTGSHLSVDHGYTVSEIEQDAIPISARLDILSRRRTEQGSDVLAMTRSLALAVSEFAESFAKLLPDVVLLMGDRYEMLAAAQCALLLGIPIVHIAGGERSEGAIDEAIRHSMTKMAVRHLVSSEIYRRRVIQLGEEPDTVVNIGALVLDSIAETPIVSKSEVCSEFGFDPAKLLFVVTLHSETLSSNSAEALAAELVSALDMFPDANLVITGANADAGGQHIDSAMKAYSAAHTERIRFHHSLGQFRYLRLLRECSAVIGNSSSGVIEAPILKVPTVNIGARQQGRLRASSVIDCEAQSSSIVAAIAEATSPAFRVRIERSIHPFGDGSPSVRVLEELGALSLSSARVKRFHDL